MTLDQIRQINRDEAINNLKVVLGGMEYKKKSLEYEIATLSIHIDALKFAIDNLGWEIDK